jgi:hypothetical protein
MAAISLKRKKWKKKLEKKTNFTRLEIWRPYEVLSKIEKKITFSHFLHMVAIRAKPIK